MRRICAVLTVYAFFIVGPAFALYSISNKGEWPECWPRELEPLRKQSRTLIGPFAAHRHFAIPFTKREELEAAWSHLVSVKCKGAPIILVRGSNFFLGDNVKAGVVVHAPPVEQANSPAILIAQMPDRSNPRMVWMNATYIELVVDGNVVDLNRLQLPADTPIIDERFKEVKVK